MRIKFNDFIEEKLEIEISKFFSNQKKNKDEESLKQNIKDKLMEIGLEQIKSIGKDISKKENSIKIIIEKWIKTGINFEKIKSREDLEKEICENAINYLPGSLYFMGILVEVFIIFYKEESSKSQKIKENYFVLENEKELKIGNFLNKKSERSDNQTNMIIRNLIQEIFLDWINYGESDSSKKLVKINPKLLRNKVYFKGIKLKDIYSNKISIREKSIKKINDINHNIIIINSCENEIKNKKLNYSFEQALKFFYYKNNAKKDLSSIINLDENKEDIIKSNILEGLKGKEEFINRKGGNLSFKKNLVKNFDKILKKYCPEIFE